jgi:hypothetical protein
MDVPNEGRRASDPLQHGPARWRIDREQRGEASANGLAQGLLIFLGLVLIVAALLPLLVQPKVTTKEETGGADPATVTKTVTTPAGRTTKTTKTRPKRTVEETRTRQLETTDVTETVSPRADKTTTVTGAQRSDAVTVALLGVGALALFAAAFHGRLESIGGAGITLTFRKADDALAKLIAAVDAVVKKNEEQDKRFIAVQLALDQLDARVDALEASEPMSGVLPIETVGRLKFQTRTALEELSTASARSELRRDQSVEMLEQAREALVVFHESLE